MGYATDDPEPETTEPRGATRTRPTPRIEGEHEHYAKQRETTTRTARSNAAVAGPREVSLMVFGMGGDGNEMEVVISGDASGLKGAIAQGITSIDKMKPKVAGLGLALSGLAVGGMAKAVSSARDWNGVQREMAKVTDPETAEELGDAIRGMAQDFPMAATELGDLATQAARFGITGTENITTFTETVAKMAAATDVSTDEAGVAFAKLSTLTKTPISDVGKLGDTINMLGQTSATSAGEIVESMLNASGTLSSMGASAQDIGALSASMNEVFNSASKAGRSLRRIGQEMTDPGKVEAFAQALGKTPEEFKAMRDNDPTGTMLKLAETMRENGEGADVLRANVSSFARQGLTALASNLDNTRAAMERSNAEWEEGGSLNREFALEAGSLGSQLQILKNRLNETAVQVGNQFLPYIKQAVGVLQQVASRFQELNGRTNGAAAAVVLVTTAVLGLVPALGLLVASVGPVVPVIVGAAGAVASLATPILLVTALVAGLALAWKNNWFGIRDVTFAVIEVVRAKINEVMPQIRDTISAAWTRIQEIWTVVLGVIRQISTAFGEWANAFWAKHGDAITAIVKKFTGAVRTVFETYIAAVRLVVSTALDFLGKIWDEHGDTIIEIVTVFTKVIAKLFDLFVGSLITAITTLFNVIEPIWDAGTAAMQVVWEKWGDEIMVVADFIQDYLITGFGVFLDGLLTAFEVALALLNGDWDAAFNHIKDFTESTFNTISGFVSKWFGGFIGNIKTWLGNTLQAFIDFGNDLIHGSVIPEMFDAVASFVTGWFGTFISSTTGYLGDVLSAFTTKFENVRSTVKDKSDAAKRAFDSAIGALPGLANDALSSVVSAFSSKLSKVKDIAGDIISTAKNAASKASSALSRARSRASSAASAARRAASKASSAASSAASAAGGIVGLASGGVVTTPTLAVVGEGREDEAVLPLSSLNTLVTDAVRAGGGGGATGRTSKTVNFNVSVNAETARGGRLAGRAFVKELRSQNFD